MKFHGLLKTTLLDYPGLVACTVFTAGCNMHCPYCHNSELTMANPYPALYTEDDILKFTAGRKNILKGICISGGEPTLNPGLYDFIEKLKLTGIAVKLDTNGTTPETVKQLCKNNLIDYIAMDIKGAPSDYERIAGISNGLFIKVKETADFLKTCGIPYEFRTTIAKDMLSPESFIKIGKWLSGSSKYYLQYYKESDNVPDKTLKTPSDAEMDSYLNILKPYLPNAKIR